jgi:hypothetical protein
MIYPDLMTIFSKLFFNEPNEVFRDIVVLFFFAFMGIREEDGLGGNRRDRQPIKLLFTYFSRFLKKANSAALLHAGQIRMDAI